MLYKYKSAYPRISENVFVAENASIIGDVTLGTQASVWFGAVLRGDVSHIIIGAGSNVQDNVTIHVSAGIPAVIGCGVTVGHNAVLHGCEIGDNTLIGMGAVVLDGAKIGRDCIIGAGALVCAGTVIPDGSMALGMPAAVWRKLRDDETKSNRDNAAEYIEMAESLG